MLAYIHAKRHGLNDEADAILELGQKTPEDVQHLPIGGALFVPPRAIGREQDPVWPLLPINRGAFSGFTGKSKRGSLPAAVQEALPPAVKANGHAAIESNAGAAAGGWGDDDLLVPEEQPKTVELSAAAAMNIDGGWGVDDDDLMKDLPAAAPASLAATSASAHGATVGGAFVVPAPGPSPTDHWFRTSQIPADHIAAGSFESAMQVWLF